MLSRKWTKSTSALETPIKRRYCDLDWCYWRFHGWSVKSTRLYKNNRRCLYRLLQGAPGILATKSQNSLSRKPLHLHKIMHLRIHRIKLEYRQKLSFSEPRKMNGSTNSPDLNPNENLQSILKRVRRFFRMRTDANLEAMLTCDRWNCVTRDPEIDMFDGPASFLGHLKKKKKERITLSQIN